MKKTIGLVLSIIFVSSLIPYRALGQSQSSSVKRNLRVLVLEGKPYERGFQHGKS